MRKYFSILIFLLWSVFFVSGQGNLGVPTNIPGIFVTAINPSLPSPWFSHVSDVISNVNVAGFNDLLVGLPDQDIVNVLEGNLQPGLANYGNNIIYSLGSPTLATCPNRIYGQSVISMGDLNLNGIKDFAVISAFDGSNCNGVIFFYEGQSGMLLYASFPPMTNTYSQDFGLSASNMGDVTGDGVNDLAVSDPYAVVSGSSNIGLVLIFDGANGGFIRQLSPPPASSSTAFGFSIDGAGDINSDGTPDIAVGSPRIFQGYYILNGPVNLAPGQGSAYVFSGADGSLIYNLQNTPLGGGTFGFLVHGESDVDRDGFRDIAVSAPFAPGINPDSGEVNIYSGATGNIMISLNPLLLFGTSPGNNRFGTYLEDGDFNGDGYGDYIIGNHVSNHIILGPSLMTSSFDFTPDGIYAVSGLITNDEIEDALYGSFSGSSLFSLGGVINYGYGTDTYTATWNSMPGLGSQGTVSATGFNPGEQNICVALSDLPLNPGVQLFSGDYLYLNTNANFLIDCSLSADFTGAVQIPNINIQFSPPTKKYVQFAALDANNNISTSNGLEIIPLP